MSIFQIDIYPSETSRFVKMNFEVKAADKYDAERQARGIIRALGLGEGTLFERAWLRDI